MLPRDSRELVTRSCVEISDGDLDQRCFKESLRRYLHGGNLQNLPWHLFFTFRAIFDTDLTRGNLQNLPWHLFLMLFATLFGVSCRAHFFYVPTMEALSSAFCLMLTTSSKSHRLRLSDLIWKVQYAHQEMRLCALDHSNLSDRCPDAHSVKLLGIHWYLPPKNQIKCIYFRPDHHTFPSCPVILPILSLFGFLLYIYRHSSKLSEDIYQCYESPWLDIPLHPTSYNPECKLLLPNHIHQYTNSFPMLFSILHI